MNFGPVFLSTGLRQLAVIQMRRGQEVIKQCCGSGGWWRSSELLLLPHAKRMDGLGITDSVLATEDSHGFASFGLVV